MRKRVTRLGATVVALVLALVIAGCGRGQSGQGEKSLLDQIKERGYITMATDGAYPPMEFQDPNNPDQLIGFDIDLGKAIAEKLGVEHRPVVVDWDGIIPGLVEHKYDTIMSSMNITDERKQSVDFVQYFEMGQVIVVPAGNPQGIASLDDLRGKTIAVQIGTTNEEIARGIEGATVNTYSTFTDALQELANGRADAVIIDEPVGRYYMVQSPDKYEVVGEPFEVAPVGIAVPKDAPELKAAIEQALQELREDGTYDQIYRKWFGEPTR